MDHQRAVRAAVLSLGLMADEDLVSLPEGKLALAVLKQAVEDYFRGFPGGRLYLTESTDRPGSWAWWCHALRIDAGLARRKVLEYKARYRSIRRPA